MGTITLTLPTSGTVITAGLHSTNYGTIQTVVNGNIDNNNFAAGKIFDPSKLMQNGATTGQVLAWNGSNYAPANGGPGAPATTLPGSPSDGQQAILVDSTSSPTYVWLFQWSATASKWVFIGGADARSFVATSETTASGSYVDLATVHSFTMPRAGVMRVQWGYTGGNSAGSQVQAALKIGGAAAGGEDARFFGNGAANAVAAVVQTREITVAASDVLKVQYLTTGGTGTFLNRWMLIRPLYVT